MWLYASLSCSSHYRLRSLHDTLLLRKLATRTFAVLENSVLSYHYIITNATYCLVVVWRHNDVQPDHDSSSNIEVEVRQLETSTEDFTSKVSHGSPWRPSIHSSTTAERTAATSSPLSPHIWEPFNLTDTKQTDWPGERLRRSIEKHMWSSIRCYRRYCDGGWVWRGHWRPLGLHEETCWKYKSWSSPAAKVPTALRSSAPSVTPTHTHTDTLHLVGSIGMSFTQCLQHIYTVRRWDQNESFD